ncbi:hypothetical protein KY359_00715 [Candidatus Woesearchaeota archaeon]|nr:hypothetical protein [Candidatus Woesearchaeota archaeon]
MPENKQKSNYQKGVSEAARLEGDYDRKANIVQKAYEAAVEELGYSDKELLDKNKAKEVAKLMFSDKYLGNAGFNKHIGSDYAKLGETDKDRTLEHSLGISLNTFVGTNGIIDRKGGLKRGMMADALENHYANKAAQQINMWAWKQAYDPKASLDQNMQNYATLLNQDPILSGSGKTINPMKFESVDDIANTLTGSMMGHTNRTAYQYRHGVDFN